MGNWSGIGLPRKRIRGRRKRRVMRRRMGMLVWIWSFDSVVVVLGGIY